MEKEKQKETELKENIELVGVDDISSCAFIVNSKDLFDKKKNPKFSLSPREIFKNPKIKKRFLD